MREAERRNPDDCDAEDDCIDEDQIVAFPTLEEVQEELDQGEDHHDEREEDHRRHVEVAKEVGDACKRRHDHRHLQGLDLQCFPVPQGEPAVARRKQRRNVGEDEDRRKKCLCDMVVDESEERAVSVVSADNGDEPGRDEPGLPVGDLLREQVGDRHHRRGHQRRDPAGHHHDLGPRRRTDEDAERRYDLDEERPPVDDVAGRVERHGVEPGVAGEVRDRLLDLADGVPGIVFQEVDTFGRYHIRCRKKTPRPEREQGEQDDKTYDDIWSVFIEIDVSHRTLLVTNLFPFEPLITLVYQRYRKKQKRISIFPLIV